MNLSQKVAQVNQYHKPFAESDYLKWLRENKVKDVHGIETKTEYLSDRFGFVKGVDTLDKRVLDTLKYTEQFYYSYYVNKRGKPI